MAAGGLVPSQTYKDLAACADNTAVILKSGRYVTYEVLDFTLHGL